MNLYNVTRQRIEELGDLVSGAQAAGMNGNLQSQEDLLIRANSLLSQINFLVEDLYGENYAGQECEGA